MSRVIHQKMTSNVAYYVFFPLSLPRLPERLRNLKLRSDRPAFWRRNFPTLLSSTLPSSHSTPSHMQVSGYVENKTLFFIVSVYILCMIEMIQEVISVNFV